MPPKKVSVPKTPKSNMYTEYNKRLGQLITKPDTSKPFRKNDYKS